MSLTNLFNIKFLKENIKRSKAVILLLIFLIPVINVIIYLMNAVNTDVYIPNIFEMMPLSIFGMYIMPIILSITLFSFVYKRKSSDFVMSFPVSKKQIFLSNTLGGILIILITNLINYLFILISTLLLNNIIIDYKMLFDLFILWTVSYIFVLTCTNIAAAMSSNKITTVAVTLLVLFLIPFIHTFITSDEFKGTTNNNIATYCDNESCRPEKYECYETSCEINKRNNIYIGTYYNEIEENPNYTMPYALIRESMLGSSLTNINSSILKMAFLSIIYIVIGLILFMRKKFEIVETSFKNEKLHIFVRSLTTIPMLCVYYLISKNSYIGISDSFTIIFLFILILTYVIIYDLLTRKKVLNILGSIISLIIVGIIVIFTGEISSKETEYIEVKKISEMTFENTNLALTGGYTNNKELINYIMSIHMENEADDNPFYTSMNIKIKINNKTYEFRVLLTEEQYNFVLETLSKDKTYLETSEEIKEKNIFAIQLYGTMNYTSKDSQLYNKIIKEFKNNKEIKEKNDNYLLDAMIYIYDDFTNEEIYFNIEKNSSLAEEILNYYNKEIKQAFEDPNIDISSYYIGKIDEDNTLSEKYFSCYEYDYKEITNFILNNIDEKIDVKKPYMFIKIYTYDENYVFVTNKVEELQILIDNIRTNEDINTGDTNVKYTY